MDHLERFRGNYETSMQQLEARYSALLTAAQQYIPENYAELITASGEGEIEHELSWVTVPDPVKPGATRTLEVQLSLGLWLGDEESQAPPGLTNLMLVGKLPDGQERVIGRLQTLGGSHKPWLMLNTGPSQNGAQEVDWDTADTEIFLKLAESALRAVRQTG